MDIKQILKNMNYRLICIVDIDKQVGLFLENKELLMINITPTGFILNNKEYECSPVVKSFIISALISIEAHSIKYDPELIDGDNFHELNYVTLTEDERVKVLLLEQLLNSYLDGSITSDNLGEFILKSELVDEFTQLQQVQEELGAEYGKYE